MELRLLIPATGSYEDWKSILTTEEALIAALPLGEMISLACGGVPQNLLRRGRPDSSAGPYGGQGHYPGPKTFLASDAILGCYAPIIRANHTLGPATETELKELRGFVDEQQHSVHLSSLWPMQAVFGWHNRRAGEERKIYLYSQLVYEAEQARQRPYLRDRMEFYLLALAVTYCHEFAHMLGTMKWGVSYQTPTALTFGEKDLAAEGGFFWETSVFGGRVVF
ncbi:hypothetical protein BC832DRAFT_539253 [Gaertneriomyces semiglobifer]|nr:hypothetical protein BC832DRAFT_539253 [Gaertneriomyces semiglobifer]